MKKVRIFTDGSSLGNPGPGGWCAILKYNQHQKIIKGGKNLTTNNEMELTAVLEGLKRLKEPCHVELFSDSRYIINAIDDWIHRWAKNNWKNASQKEIAHKVIWQELYKLLQKHDVKPIWIKGHAGHEENEICDRIAREEAKKFNR